MSTLVLLTMPPCGNVPCKALTQCITCIRLFLPQGFHKLQHCPRSIFHPWRKKGGKESEPEGLCRHVPGDGCWEASQHHSGGGWLVLAPHQAPKEPCALNWWSCFQACLQTPLRPRAERRQPGENLPALCLTLPLQQGCMCGS